MRKFWPYQLLFAIGLVHWSPKTSSRRVFFIIEACVLPCAFACTPSTDKDHTVYSSLLRPFYASTGTDSSNAAESSITSPQNDDDDYNEMRRRITTNQIYISTLEKNLHSVLDKWTLNGNQELVSRFEKITC